MPSANRDPQGSTEATRAYSIIPSFTEASRVYSVILQRQSLGYIRHALNMYFRFPFFLSFLKFEILVNKGSPIAIKLSTPLTVSGSHCSSCYPFKRNNEKNFTTKTEAMIIMLDEKAQENNLAK
jgi:hypothetical protein